MHTPEHQADYGVWCCVVDWLRRNHELKSTQKLLFVSSGTHAAVQLCADRDTLHDPTCFVCLQRERAWMSLRCAKCQPNYLCLQS